MDNNSDSLSERIARLEQKVDDGFSNIEGRLDDIANNSDLKVIVNDYNNKIDRQSERIADIETKVKALSEATKRKTVQTTAIASILSIIITYLVTYFLEDITNK